MLTQIINLLTWFSNLPRRIHIAYLRWCLADEEATATNVQAYMLAAPSQLIKIRSRITDLRNKLAGLEAAHER